MTRPVSRAGKRTLPAAIVLFALGSTPAIATDGVKLLKQPATFPIVISTPGSYRLKGNLVVPDANTTAIQITTDDVTLDLNGFRISGPTACVDAGPLSCSPTGAGNGIDAAGHSVVIRNGTVRGMGNHGVTFSSGRAEDLTVTGNGSDGVYIGSGIITGCTVTSNGGAGIAAASGNSLVTGCLVSYNGTSGISASGAVIGNVATANGQGEVSGIGIGSNGLAIGNAVQSNFGGGIFCNGTVVNNWAVGNGGPGILDGDGLVSGNTVVVNAGDGNRFPFASIGAAIGNASLSNGGYGLNMSTGNAFETNTMLGNTSGTVSGGVAMGTNVCDGSTTCP